MSLRMPAPRLLPLTIGVMAALLVVKSTELVLAAVPSSQSSAPALAVPALLATAQAAAAEPPAPAAKPEPAAPPASPPKPEEASPVSDGERTLLLDLRHRRAELEAREAALASREAVLSATERGLSRRVDELTSLQARLEALERARREHDEANWHGLVKLYESMRPRDAAAIFNDLDKPVLLGVLDRMKEVKAAAVLAAMLPERARQATADLAQLRAQANRAPEAAKPPS
jgi:flagellar motility protein MotE (MotC chaperone)